MNNDVKKIEKFVFSFRVKVSLVLILALCCVMWLSVFFIYRMTLEFQFEQLREKLTSVAQTSALLVDADALARIPSDRSGIGTPEYQAIEARLNKLKIEIPGIQYIYTLRKTAQPNLLEFVVDPDPVLKKTRKFGATAYPGDPYDASRFPAMMEGFHRATSDSGILEDAWGKSLSGYAPICDSRGNAVAVLGVDMDADNVYLTQEKVRRLVFLVWIMGLLISTGLGFYIADRITLRIRKLVEGTRRIAADDLAYKVRIQGGDEIGELATSFNEMALSLFESRKKLQEYFYRVVQSLVRILEAKDKYTCGHSERVAEYSYKIALKMGFPEEKADLLQKVAQLHDIGKLAIPENILNKPGKLTEEEWKVIREHSVIGAEALRPIFLDESVLSMVLSHHEKYDGSGYPQALKGDEINLCAQIISVADAYDAMTSTRAYRNQIGQDEAIRELEHCAGVQFNPEIVKAFKELLAKEV